MKKILLLLALFSFVAFSACKKDNIDKDDYEKDGEKDYEKDYDKEACFELIYPITYEMPDGSTITVEDEEGMWTDIKAWYEAHPDVEEKPSLQYPVDIVFTKWDDEDDEENDEEEVITINNEEEMIEAKKDCYDDKEDCFDLVYPISFEMPDGSFISGDKETVWDAIKEWYTDHPDSEEKPALQYPVDIVYENEENDEMETLTINNEEEMMEAKKDCYEDEDKDGCFELVFPYTFIMPDGSTITADNEENLWIAVEEWYENHPDVAEEPSLQYPVDVIINEGWDEENDEEGDAITINNEAEMMELKEGCYDEKEACFKLIFPLSVTMPDGSTISGDNEETLVIAIEAWYEANPDANEENEPVLNFPVTIEYEDGETVEIANQEALTLAKEDCYTEDDGE